MRIPLISALKHVAAALAIMISGAAAGISAQSTDVRSPAAVEPYSIRTSAAYTVVLMRKAELEADLATYLDDYTESNPKVVDTRFELDQLNRDIDKLFATKPTETAKLTESLGKMVVRKAALAAEYNRLLLTYTPEHPLVKRAKKKAEVFASAVKQLIG